MEPRPAGQLVTVGLEITQHISSSASKSPGKLREACSPGRSLLWKIALIPNDLVLYEMKWSCPYPSISGCWMLRCRATGQEVGPANV